MKKSTSILIYLIVATALQNAIFASEIREIAPLTRHIILIKIDDGTVIYPNDLQAEPLDMTAAVNSDRYTISSTDDPDFSSPIHPVSVGRKTKGTEFVKDAPWGGNSFDPRSKPWASEHYIYLIFDVAMKPGKHYAVNTSDVASNGSDWDFIFIEHSNRSEAVHVNTIGYETHAPKYGYIYQWMGDQGGLDLTSYAGAAFHLIKTGEEDPVYSGILNKRKSASNAETDLPDDTPGRNFLGAEVYECDFTGVEEDGEYTLVVEGIGCSYPFRIGKDALWDAYYTCGRSLFYQRSGIRLSPPFTDGDYIRPVNQNTRVTSDDGTSFEGLLLYSDYPYMDWDNSDNGGSSRQIIRDSAMGKTLDVAGWYHDAGDWDSYYSHQRIPILLMTTFEFALERYADNDLNIPESGNGIPDILDEASWLIKFNYRLRKELMAKGYSDGGLGGARICPDVFSPVDGNAEQDKPSWKDHRRYVVTQADAFMTYLYAGQAAQFAAILRQMGKDPNHFPVEMLDHVDYLSMSRDTVNWEEEARAAYAWASDPSNQPAHGNNYEKPLGVYRLYAAANLFRLCNEESYHTDARAELEILRNSTSLQGDERWGVYAYLLADNHSTDALLKSRLQDVALSTARMANTNAIQKRACRWGGNLDMPMLVGQATTPWMFESIVAFGLTGDKFWSDAIHTTADYFLGTNPLHTTWATHLGPRPPESGFHLDSRYNNNWVLYPGFVPYGPWSMSFGYDPYTWVIDGISMEGGHGPWNKDWANFSMYPLMDEWPGHERWNSNIHAPMSTENTVHQNSVFVALTYGFVNGRNNTNAAANRSISNISLNKTSLTLNQQGALDTLLATPDIQDADFALLHWRSSDARIAHVDRQGRVTAITPGTCVITCSTLDGSVEASCDINCDWAQVGVDSIRMEPDSLTLTEGQTAGLSVFFSPEGATNQFVDWSFSVPDLVEVDEFGVLSALRHGEVWVTATSLNGAQKDSCYVEVVEARDYLIADFDSVKPVLTAPNPNWPQLYTPGGGSSNMAAVNPLSSLSNPSPKVVRYNHPGGDWKLLGMVMPTGELQDLGKYVQFQFKYFGSGINEIYIQLVPETGENTEFRTFVEAEETWRLFVFDLDLAFPLKQFNIFVNPQGNQAPFFCYFDDFKLVAEAAVWYADLSISDSSIELDPEQVAILVAENDGIPFSWITSNPEVATVDQQGIVSAISPGSASIVAVPLYGDARTCMVKVNEGETDPDTTIAVSGIYIEGGNQIFIEKDESRQLVAHIVPDSATNQGIRWESSASVIATVSAHGLVQGMDVGSATITANAMADSSIRTSIEVRIEDHTGTGFYIPGEVRIFPNPAGRHFTISAGKAIQKIEIMNIFGESVYSRHAEGVRKAELHDMMLNSGVYLVGISLGSQEKILLKLIIDK